MGKSQMQRTTLDWNETVNSVFLFTKHCNKTLTNHWLNALLESIIKYSVKIYYYALSLQQGFLGGNGALLYLEISLPSKNNELALSQQ